MRINKTWLRMSEIKPTVRKRLKRSKQDFVNYYSLDYPKYFNNEEGS